MFRLFLRDALLAGALLVLLAGAAVVLGLPAVAPPPAQPWVRELARVQADPALLARDGALLLFALAALGAVLNLLLSGLRLLGRDYPAAAHLAEVLASRLVRRAGALAGVLLAVLPGTGAARASAPSRQAAVAASAPRITLVHTSGAPPTPPAPVDGSAQVVRRRASAGVPGRRPVRRVGLALRYVVQPDDTMDGVAARFGLPDWRPIMQATRGVLQPVGGSIVDPDLIYPGQILHIPLPCPALRVSDGHVFYVVQQADTLSGIAARFLGNWRSFRQIGDLNRGVHQPDGGALEDDNLIQPGWVLRLPQEYVVAGPDGASVTHHILVPDIRPARRRHVLRPRRPHGMPAHHGQAFPHHRPAPVRPHPMPHPHKPTPVHLHAAPHRHGLPPAHLHPAPRHHEPVANPPVRRAGTHPATSHGTPEHPHHSTGGHAGPHGRRPILRRAPGRRLGPGTGPGGRPAQPRHPAQHSPTQHPAVEAHHSVRRHPVEPRHRVRHPRVVQRRPGAHPRKGVRTVGTPVPRPARGAPASCPLVHVPDLGRALPVAFVLGFLAFAAAVAASRRRALRRGLGRMPARVGALAPSVRRALRAVLEGVEGRLTRALRRTPTATGGLRAAHVVALLEKAGREAGAPYSLADAVRLLVETAETMELQVEAPRLSAPLVNDVAARLGTALGVPVAAASHVERDGTPLVTLSIKTATLVAPAEVRPHPAPLLVPVGATTDGAVVHLHLGRTGGLLVAGNGQSLVATLLASTVYQAPPDALRLLVASDDDELRKALPQIDHLEAPPADARDARAVANLIAQAHTLVLERYERYGAPAAGMPPAPPAPPVPCLLVLAGMEGLPDEALDRLDAVAHTGPVCGVHLIATTSDPAALAANGMLALFRTRLARRLAPADGRLVCPDADVSALGPHDALLCGLGPQQQLRAFTLAPPEVREVLATVAAATLPPLPAIEVPPGPPPVPPPAPPSVPDGREEEPEQPAAHEASLGESDSPVPESMHQVPDPAKTEKDGAPATAGTESGMATRPAGAPVRIDLLGGITVRVQGQPINILPRERNLLAALAVMGPRPVRRVDLIDALFADDEDGGNTLSHALSNLRAALRRGGLPREQARDVVLKSSGGYFLHPDLVEVDLWRFDALLRQAEGLDEAEAGPVRAEAFALYHGRLCEGEALDFLEEHGYRWMKGVPSALYMLADHYHETGDLKSALYWTRRLLADDPCDDHTNQLVLTLLAEMGDADGLDAHMQAMRERYATHKQRVDPYTVHLYEQLRQKVKSESKAG